MSTPYLSEIKMFSFSYPPQGWALCNGQTLAINQNQALFSLLGTTYGGNGQTTFALPNLQGRTPMHTGSGLTLGQIAGEPFHTLSATEMPQHTHIPLASAGAPDVNTPVGNTWASNTGFSPYAPLTGGVAMAATAISTVGGSQAHENRSPFLTLSFCIALQGIFPSRN